MNSAGLCLKNRGAVEVIEATMRSDMRPVQGRNLNSGSKKIVDWTHELENASSELYK